MYTANEEVTVEPAGNCICPSESYICRADGVNGIELDNKGLSDPFLHISGFSKRLEVEKEGLMVLLSEVKVDDTFFNLTARLFIIDPQTWNGTIISCRTTGNDRHKDIHICVTGIKLLIHVNKRITFVLSVQVQPPLPLVCQLCGTHHQLWSVSSLQCMVENVWTIMWSLLSVKRGWYFVMSPASDAIERNCSIDIGDGNVNDFNFTVHAVTRVNDSFVYNGETATDCCKYLSQKFD